MKKTKLIVTVGPETGDVDSLRDIIKSGCDVIRINMSYASRKFCDLIIKRIRDLEKELHKFVGIMLDTNGPCIRIGDIKGDSVDYTLDSLVNIYPEKINVNEESLCFNYNEVYDVLDIGDVIELSDGSVELEVIERDRDCLIGKVIKEGTVYGKSAVYFKNNNFRIPFVSKDDKDNILYAIKREVDFLTLSYVRDEDDVQEVVDLLIENGDNHIEIISKIETPGAINNIDRIIDLSDGIMIERNDLSVEISVEKIPYFQKQILEKVYDAGKIGIVATDIIMDNIDDVHPMSSEVVDVYNAVIDNCDALLLSGETTEGNYTIETINTINKIIESAEEDFDYRENLNKIVCDNNSDMTTNIAFSTVDSSLRLDASCIFCYTNSGYTARKLSHFRPRCTVISYTNDPMVCRSNSILYGIKSIYGSQIKNTDKLIKEARNICKKELKLIKDDIYIVNGGIPMSKKITNFMKIDKI